MKRLEERAAVRLGIPVEQHVVSPSRQRPLAGRDVVQRRILDDEIALAHRAVHVNDRMARRAGEARLRFGRRDLFFDRPVEPAIEEHRVIVASRAPFRWRGAGDVLHVLDRLSVPLVVERREVVRRGAPLVVDVLVAAAAGGARHEKVRRDHAAARGVGGRREERTVWPRALLLHRQRRL